MDREATFSRLYDEYRDRIYRMCCYYVSGEEDRKDLYQEVLHNIWKGLGSFRGDSALSTWVYRVTVNSSLAFIAKQKTRKKKMVEFGEFVRSRPRFGEGVEGRSDIDLLYDAMVEGRSEIDLLYHAIAELPLIDMIIMSLVLEEASTKEIASATGLTESNVRVRIHRAKDRLKGLIESEALGGVMKGRDGS
jgi:RNA polymerase sigma-70 factor (ECF subfamily)